MVCSLLPAVIGNILNVQGGSLCGHRCYTLSMVWAVISNVQKSTVSRNPRNSVVKLPLRVRELQRVKKNWKKRTKSKKCQGGFLRA